MTSRASKDSNHNERRNEQNVHDNQQDAEKVGTNSADSELEERGDDGVKDGGGKNAFYGSVGSSGSSGETNDLCDTD